MQTSGQDTESIAIFALARYDITDKVSISGGFRYVDENKTFHTQYNAMLGTDVDPIYGTAAWTDAPIQNPRTTKSDSWDDYMGDATIDWQATEDNLFYIRYARGFRSGGYSMRQAQSETLTASRVASLNAQGFPVTQQAHACEGCDYGNFDPELTEMFEIGSKNSFMNDTLQINGAIFQTTTEGFQAQAILSTPGALSQTDTYINNYQETPVGLTIDDLNKYLSAVQTHSDISLDQDRMSEGLFNTDKAIHFSDLLSFTSPLTNASRIIQTII